MAIQWDDEPKSSNVVWDNVQWDDDKTEKSYAKRVLTESAPAVLNMVPDIVNAGVAGLMGVGDAVGGMVRGKGIGPSLSSGAETFERGMESMREPGRPGIPRFHGKGVEESEQALMGLIDKGVGYVGDITEDPLPFAIGYDTPTEFLSPAGRTIGEAATNFAPIFPAVKGVKGSQQARQGRIDAQRLLEQKERGEAEYRSWETDAEASAKMRQDLLDMDNVMIQYGKELQAPQLGLGGKVAKHEDQIGKREKGTFSNQMAWDEEMYKTGKDYQEVRDLAHEEALQKGQDHLGQYGPTTAGTTLDHAPSPVRPYQMEQIRPGRISEGEATQIYLKPPFRRTTEERLKLQEYEASLKGPNLDSIGNERTALELDRDGKPIDFPYREGGGKRPWDKDIDDPKTWSITSYRSTETQSGKRQHNIVDKNGEPIEAFDTKHEAEEYLRNARTNYKPARIDTDKVDVEVNKHLDSYLNKDNGQKGRGDVNYDRDGNPIDFPHKEGGYAYTEFKKDLEAKGITVADSVSKAMYEASSVAEQSKPIQAHPKGDAVRLSAKVPGLERIKQEYKDDRPWEEVLPIWQQTPDVGMVHKNVVAKILGGKFTAGDHPGWGWTSSQIHMIKHQSMQSASARLHGKSRKNPDPGTYNYTWKQLTGKMREAVNDFGWKHNNSDVPVSSAELAKLGPKERQAYQERVKINKEVLNDINKVLEAEGKQPIQPLPNYWSPSIVDQPFIVKFKDATGETRKVAGFYRQPDVKALQRIAAEHKMTAELMPERGVRGELDFDQIEWVLRHLSKEMRDPAAKGISEGLRRQGFMKHGIKRKGAEGGEGSQGGRKALREYEETSEKYIRRAYEYIANRELDKLYNKVLDEKSLDGQPYAKAFALEAIDTARGGANKSFEGFSKAVGDIVSGTIQVGTFGKVKLPNRFARDLLRHSNKVKTTLLLGFGNVTNIAANILQAPTYGLPAMMSVVAKAGFSTADMLIAVPKALGKTGAEMLKWDNSADITKLREIGALDATFKYDWSTYASAHDPRWKATAAEHLTGISTLSYIESNAVRRPASLMFLNILREIGYDKVAKSPDEIYYVAKEMTDKYMVSTRWYEKPHMFSRSGIVGTAMSPLQSFTTTWLGMLKEYGKLSKEGLLEGSVAKQVPLGVFLSMNIMTAGLMGLIGIKEWDALATFANKHFGYNIPTGTEWIMSNWKSNKVRFGLLSDAVGFHIGATFNAPTLTGSFAPGVQQLGDAANFLGTAGKWTANQFGADVAAPQAVERREAMKGMTPRFNWIDRAGEALGIGSTGLNWADIEKRATPEGAPYQDMAGNAGPVTRDAEDWRARKFGTYTTKEATEKTENYLMQREGDERSARLSKAISRAADILLMNPNDPNVMDKIEPLIAKLEEDRFKGNEIRDALKRELLSKKIEADTRAIGKGKSSRQAYIYQLLEQLR